MFEWLKQLWSWIANLWDDLSEETKERVIYAAVAAFEEIFRAYYRSKQEAKKIENQQRGEESHV